MTLLVTAVRDDFVLSVADRRSSVQQGNTFVVQDDHFNKHVLFGLIDDKGVRFNGAATFTGVAQWTNGAGQLVTTDQVIASAFAAAASMGVGHGLALHMVAHALARERRFIETKLRGRFPGFTVMIGGFLSGIREPFLALITDDPAVPNWDEDRSQIEIPAPSPFRIHFAIRCRPSICLGGFLSALPSVFRVRLDLILAAPALRAYDVARYVIRGIRAAADRSASVGRRASAILFPSSGWADTGLWQLPGESLRCLMPMMVLKNGKVIDSSEMGLSLQMLVGELPRHGLLFEGMLDSHVSKRLLRRVKRFRSSNKAPTIFGMLGFVLFGEDPGEAEREVRPSGRVFTLKGRD